MLGDDEKDDIWNNGKKLGPNPNKTKYTCEKTGAHFEHMDMFRRLDKLRNLRDIDVDQFVAVALNIHTVMNSIYGPEVIAGKRSNGNVGGKHLNKSLDEKNKVNEAIKKQRAYEA